MKTTRIIFAVAAMLIVSVTPFQGCALFPESTEVTDPNPSDDIHTIHKTMSMVSEELEADRSGNLTRYKHKIQNWPDISFIGEITEIKGARLQFHIKKTWFPFDKYAECDFVDDSKLNDERINKGGIVTVKGKVTDLPITEEVLKLTSCSILQFH